MSDHMDLKALSGMLGRKSTKEKQDKMQSVLDDVRKGLGQIETICSLLGSALGPNDHVQGGVGACHICWWRVEKIESKLPKSISIKRDSTKSKLDYR